VSLRLAEKRPRGDPPNGADPIRLVCPPPKAYLGALNKLMRGASGPSPNRWSRSGACSRRAGLELETTRVRVLPTLAAG